METSEILNVFLKTDPFDMLDQQVLIDLCKKVKIKKYPVNKYIFKQGDTSLDGLFIIASEAPMSFACNAISPHFF